MTIRNIRHLFGFALFFCWASTVFGQSRPLPNSNYYAPFREFYQADYRSAGNDYNSGATSAYKFGTQRYLDSICYWTMVGECHYHLGNYGDAIQMYEQSLNLYLEYQTLQWQARLQMPPSIQRDDSNAQRVRMNWGTSGRNAKIARMPDSFSILFGRLDAERTLQTGGVVQNAEMRQIDLSEIMRCTALSLHRRRVIKGPTCKFDPFSSTLVNGLRGVAVGDGTLMGAFNGVLLGIAEASLDDWDAAAKTLNRSLQFNGGMDHTLTPVALIELANIGIETGNFEVAQRLALEASYSAASVYQYDLIEEALSIGSKLHLLNNKSAYPPLEPAIIWANKENARLMQASLTVRLAECLAEADQPDLAAKALGQLRSVINTRNSLPKAVVSSRARYVSALINFEKANFVDGMSDLVSALASFQTGSLWLYRLGLADNLAINGNIGDRQADLMYGALLRDPDDRDWKLDPLESIAFLASNHVGPLERWFDIVVNRKEMDRAIDVAELIRRHRFFARLPLGGRLMAFRWVMHAPIEALSDNAMKQRRDFLAQHTQYQQWTDRTEQIRTALLLLPLKPAEKSDEAREQSKLIIELGELSNLQEAYLASLSLRRLPAEMVFPPQADISRFRENIGKKQLALVSLETSSGYHLFFVNSVSVQYIGLSRQRDVQRDIAALLKKLGLMETSIDLETLQSTEWRETAKELTPKLFGNIPVDAWKDVSELVIVPDGVLWYLPFEVLQIGDGESQKNLADVVPIRYSPTLFLAYRTQRPMRESTRTAVITSKLHPKGDVELSSTVYQELVAEMPTAVNLDRSLRLSSNLVGSVMDQLIVWDELQAARNADPLGLHPMPIDQNKVGASLGDWQTLPWYGPEHVTMPVFHSDGGTAMRGKMNGTDLFYTTIGLMGAGSRTILISRWRTGGANSLELTRNYVQRLPKMGGEQAFKESVAAAKDMDLKYADEPQLKMKSKDAVVKAEHPFFWAGLMRMEIPIAPPAEAEMPKTDDEVKLPGDNENQPGEDKADPEKNNGIGGEVADQNDG